MTVPFSRVLILAGCALAAGCAGPHVCRGDPSSHYATVAPIPVNPAIRDVRSLLDAQVAAWNRYDLDGYLAAYRRDEHVVFVTPEGSSRGFAELEARYRKAYNAPEHFGELAFSDFDFTTVDATTVVVRGSWRLKRAKDSPHGRFELVVCKLAEGWRIVSDFTTVETTGG